MKANLPVNPEAEVIPVLVCPDVHIDAEARPHLEGVKHWKQDDYVAYGKRALGVLRELRTTFYDRGDMIWRAAALERLRHEGLDPATLMGMLERAPAAELGSKRASITS